MKIFITGATGYVGSKLVEHLLEKGHHLQLLVRSINKSAFKNSSCLKIFSGDIQDIADVRKAMTGCKQVYHLAAIAKVWLKRPSIFYNINVLGTKNILDAARENKIDKIVYCSTAGVFGASFNGEITELSTRQYDYSNEYESSKAMSESLIKNYVILYGMNIVITCPTRIYGPCNFVEPTLVNFMVKKYLKKQWKFIPGNGDKIGNYIYIDDVIQGLTTAMTTGRSGHTYILGGYNHSMNTFFKTLKKVSGVNVKMYRVPIWIIYIFSKIQLFLAEFFNIPPLLTPKWVSKTNFHWKVSSLKAQNELNLHPTSLANGLGQTVHWLQNDSNQMYNSKILKPC